MHGETMNSQQNVLCKHWHIECPTFLPNSQYEVIPTFHSAQHNLCPTTSEFVVLYHHVPQRYGHHVPTCDVSSLQGKKGNINFPLCLIKSCDGNVWGTVCIALYAFELDIMVSGRIHVLASSSLWKERQLPFERGTQWAAGSVWINLEWNKKNTRWLLVTLTLAGQSRDKSRSSEVLDRAVPLYRYRSCAQICMASYVINTVSKTIVLVVMTVVTSL
jgi:hypothetical protein